MTEYDRIPNHPLAGVPPEVLRATRAVLGQARDVDLHDTDDRNALADAVTLALHQTGYLTWHTWRPPTNRDSLVALTNEVINAYLADDEARRRGTVVEVVIDRVVLPLLRRTVDVPDRESLVVGCQAAAGWRSDEGSSVMEAVVDEVILPLLRRSNGEHGTAGTADPGGGVRRADPGA